MPTFTEKSSVEDYIIEKLVEKGWKFVPADQLERESYEEPLLVKNLVKAVKRINRGFELSESDMNKILVELKHRAASSEGVKQILRFLKQGIAIKLEKSRELRFVQLFDYENLGNNEFIVSRQVKYERGEEGIRPDIVLYVNGIPLVMIECKNPADPSTSWWDAYLQIKDYEGKVPEPFKYVQFSIAAEETARYFPNSPWREREAKTYVWRAGEFDVLDATLEMLYKENLLDLVKNFVFIREERGRTKKVISRYMQYRAANKICERVIKNFKGEDKRKNGLVWHWQGSGKTLTMIFAAHKLYRNELLENPTIFFILDRLDLEEQLSQELNTLDMGVKPEMISSIKKLKDVLAHDGGRGKRGIFVTLVHKFRPGEILEFEKELNTIREKETVSTRKNVVCFIDEGHRTQYGTLAAQMRNVLKNAFFFAFTGTPIAKKGRDTFREFSYPEEGENYLDKYFMLDSIKDDFTVKILYQARMEKKVHLRKELLEFFLEQELEEIPEELRKDVEKRIKKKIGAIKLMMKIPKRIEEISRDITEHFKENVDGKFKAMVVAVDRDACVRYKRILDKFLPPEYSEIVMTFNAKTDPREIKSYLEELIDEYKGRDIEEIRKEIIERFKHEEYPKILIVTDMLITGFDAPILQTMYLDKPLKEHRLIQAIARTNRPHRGLKEAGLILDYVGIFRELEKALSVYNKEDVEHVAYDVKEEEKRFDEIIKKLLGIFEGVDKKSYERENLMKAVSILAKDENKAKSFRRGYRNLRKIFELLGPHPLKLKHLEMYKWLTSIYHTYNRHVKRIDPDETERYARKYFSKTIDNIYKSIDIDKIKKSFPILYFDDKYIEKLERLYPDLESRVSDMVFTLNKYILVDKSRSPVYESIVDKVERVVKAWKERKANMKELYKQAKTIFQEINILNKRQKELGLSNMEYYMLSTLEKMLGESEQFVTDVKELAKDVQKATFKGWSIQPSAVKDVGIVVRRYLRKQKISKEQRDELYEKIIKMLKEFD